MSYATVRSCTLSGISALPVTVEIHISGGLPGMSIVGLPQSAVRESKDRVKAAIVHADLKYPMVKIVVNLAPADLPKQGGRFDLPIALGVLVATGQLPEDSLDNMVVVGELGLTGYIRAVSGALPTALAFSQHSCGLLMPLANYSEASRSPRTKKESMETASIQSISHAGFNDNDWGYRPFRSPHHTASGVALVGGGAKPMPGEISLAHNGVLFLDELSEFPSAVLDVLREPMETGRINISRAAKQCEFPAQFQLDAAMNACLCSNSGIPNLQCYFYLKSLN